MGAAMRDAHRGQQSLPQQQQVKVTVPGALPLHCHCTTHTPHKTAASSWKTTTRILQALVGISGRSWRVVWPLPVLGVVGDDDLLHHLRGKVKSPSIIDFLFVFV